MISAQPPRRDKAKRKFVIGQVVTTSKCSFLRNRLLASCTIVGHLPESQEGFSYSTQKSAELPELVTMESQLLPAET